MSATVHPQYADINATRSSHHEFYAQFCILSLSPLVSLSANVSLAYPPGSGSFIKHSEAVQLNFFFFFLFPIPVSAAYIVFRGSWGDVVKL